MKPRVLVVDDEEELVQTLAERLTLRDYDVSTSLSGEDAVEKSKHYNFDVVILDVAMPGMDGIETLRKIKSTKPLTEVSASWPLRREDSRSSNRANRSLWVLAARSECFSAVLRCTPNFLYGL